VVGAVVVVVGSVVVVVLGSVVDDDPGVRVSPAARSADPPPNPSPRSAANATPPAAITATATATATHRLALNKALTAANLSAISRHGRLPAPF
jgi:hypothetical protein